MDLNAHQKIMMYKMMSGWSTIERERVTERETHIVVNEIMEPKPARAFFFNLRRFFAAAVVVIVIVWGCKCVCRSRWADTNNAECEIWMEWVDNEVNKPNMVIFSILA